MVNSLERRLFSEGVAAVTDSAEGVAGAAADFLFQFYASCQIDTADHSNVSLHPLARERSFYFDEAFHSSPSNFCTSVM